MGYLLASLKTKTGPFNQKETDRFFLPFFRGKLVDSFRKWMADF